MNKTLFTLIVAILVSWSNFATSAQTYKFNVYSMRYLKEGENDKGELDRWMTTWEVSNATITISGNKIIINDAYDDITEPFVFKKFDGWKRNNDGNKECSFTGIHSEHYPHYMNFILKDGELLITLDDGICYYEFAVSDPGKILNYKGPSSSSKKSSSKKSHRR